MSFKSNIFVRATIRFVESVETSDDPEHFHIGPDYDLYEVTVDSGPESAFLRWFEQDNQYELCRVGNTSQFVDVGGGEAPEDGEVINLTFEEFLPRWLDVSVRIAQAEILSMSRNAISRLAHA